jgi:aspartate kinase
MNVVYKLGGTSQCKVGYDKLINILNNNNTINNFIILSAVSGVTNNLVKFTETKDLKYIENVIKLNSNLINELNIEPLFFNYIYSDLNKMAQKYIDSFDMCDVYAKSEIIGYGEIISTNIFNTYLSIKNIKNIKHRLLDSYEYIFSKKEIYQCNSSVEFYADSSKLNKLENNYIYILQGFIASTLKGNKIILGRGGSDTTGSLIAKAINANFYEVWTDVDGIYTGDPRIFNTAYKIKQINYDLCQELSAMGAKVMHPLSIKPCMDSNIPIYVKNTFSNSEGTKISYENNNNDIFYAIQKNQTVFKIKSLDMWNSYGFITNIFRQFSENRIDINIVTTSQFSISATTSEKNIYKLLEIKDMLE